MTDPVTYVQTFPAHVEPPYDTDRCEFVPDDGGRAHAGYSGRAGDCVTRAIAIATMTPYADVYDELNRRACADNPRRRTARAKSGSRDGVHRRIYEPYLLEHGWVWVPTMQIGSGCHVHLRADELPSGRLVVRLSRHLAAVVDGVVYDTSDPSRGGSRCVYGYYQKALSERRWVQRTYGLNDQWTES